MKNLIKASLLSVGILSVMGLTACQSNPQQAQAKQQMQNKGERQFHKDERRHEHARGHHHQQRHFGGRGDDRRTPLTAEQRAEFEKKRTERLAQHQAQRAAIAKACEGKAGQNITVKIGEKSIEGSCQVQFRPTRPERLTPKVQKETIQDRKSVV